MLPLSLPFGRLYPPTRKPMPPHSAPHATLSLPLPPLQEGVRVLTAAGRYAELAALYNYHGWHAQVAFSLPFLSW